MKVQKIRIPNSSEITWIVLDDSYLSVAPIGKFLRYLRNLERSPNTIRSYAYHLRLYWEYLKDVNLDWKAVGVTDLADFIGWLRNPLANVASMQEQEAKRTEATVNAIITCVGVFYDFHKRDGTVESIPIYDSQVQPRTRYKKFLHHINRSKPVRIRLLTLKEPRRSPKTLTKAQIERLIAACHRIRDKFLLCLLYETGMRIGQALGLRHQDIQSWDNQIQIVPRVGNVNRSRPKTSKAYIVHVSMELMSLYTDYLLNEFNQTDCEYVFVNLWDGEIGAPTHYGAVADLFHRLSHKTGIKVSAL